MTRRPNRWKFRLVRGILIAAAVYAAVLVIWTRVVSPRRVAAMTPATRMRVLRWEDRLRLPAILAVVPPAFIAAFGVYLPIATALHEAWLAVARRGTTASPVEQPTHRNS